MKVNEIITNQVIENLEKNGKWFKNWQSLNNANLVSKKAYRGINTLLLAMSREKNSFKSNYWATFKQITKNKGKVKKGSKSTTIIFYSKLEHKKVKIDGVEKIDSNSPSFALRYYRVFNIDQTDGIEIDESLIGENNEEIPQAKDVIESYINRENITASSPHDGACFIPALDKIQMPGLKQYKSSEDFYRDFFHEITHSTGVKKRLNRYSSSDSIHNKVSYSKEELVAELGSLFLSANSGIDPDIKNASAYIRGWCKALKKDPQLIISASSKAQKAFDYVLNIK